MATINEKNPASDTDVSVPSVMIDEVEAQGWDAKTEKKLLRKLDWHIIPFMSLIYLYVFLSL